MYRRPGRRNHAPNRRTYAFASAIPVRAPGAPIHDDERPRADLSVATVGRGLPADGCPRWRPRRAITHTESRPARRARCAYRSRQPFGAYDAPRVLTDAAARTERRGPRRVRYRRRARGSRAIRGPRQPLPEHARPRRIGVRQPFPTGRGQETSTWPYRTRNSGFQLSATPDTTKVTTKKKHDAQRQKDHPRRQQHPPGRLRTPLSRRAPRSGRQAEHGRAPGRRAARVPRVRVRGRR